MYDSVERGEVCKGGRARSCTFPINAGYCRTVIKEAKSTLGRKCRHNMKVLRVNCHVRKGSPLRARVRLREGWSIPICRIRAASAPFRTTSLLRNGRQVHLHRSTAAFASIRLLVSSVAGREWRRRRRPGVRRSEGAASIG